MMNGFVIVFLILPGFFVITAICMIIKGISDLSENKKGDIEDQPGSLSLAPHAISVNPSREFENDFDEKFRIIIRKLRENQQETALQLLSRYEAPTREIHRRNYPPSMVSFVINANVILNQKCAIIDPTERNGNFADFLERTIDAYQNSDEGKLVYAIADLIRYVETGKRYKNSETWDIQSQSPNKKLIKQLFTYSKCVDSNYQSIKFTSLIDSWTEKKNFETSPPLDVFMKFFFRGFADGIGNGPPISKYQSEPVKNAEREEIAELSNKVANHLEAGQYLEAAQAVLMKVSDNFAIMEQNRHIGRELSPN